MTPDITIQVVFVNCFSDARRCFSIVTGSVISSSNTVDYCVASNFNAVNLNYPLTVLRVNTILKGAPVIRLGARSLS